MRPVLAAGCGPSVDRGCQPGIIPKIGAPVGDSTTSVHQLVCLDKLVMHNLQARQQLRRHDLAQHHVPVAE